MRYFLATWKGEEAEHGYIFKRIAAESMGHTTKANELIDPSFFSQYQPEPTFAQRNSQELVALSSEVTNSFPAIYATFGAVQEQSVIRAYELLKRRINDERVDLVLDEIISQEKRHFRTYFEWAKYYLKTDPLAQRVVRKGLEKIWKPVGFDAMGGENWEELYDYLCPTQEDRDYFTDVDRVVQLLPGMEGLTIMGDAVAKIDERKKKQLVAA